MSEIEQRKKDFSAGYLAGLTGLPLAITPAVASDPLYLYGGVPLPPLPAQWDRETYPYAIIATSQPGVYYLSVYKSINYFDRILVFDITNKYFGTTEDGTALVFKARPGETSWSQTESTKWSVNVQVGVKNTVAIWTHGFDLLYSDDSLYVAASAPGRITDWDALQGKYFYNEFIGPYFDFYLPNEHSRYIIKTETKYVYFECVSALGGACFICDGSKVYIYNGEWDYIIDVQSRDIDGGEWQVDSERNYLGEEYEYNGKKYHYICSKSDILWSEDDIFDMRSGSVAFYGSERVPAPVPETRTDNKAIMLGCRLGYIVRSQMGKGNIEIPDGVLISSDGYILTDCNGVYLIASVAAEPDEPEKPDAPEEPDEPEEVATMYLYGTPSESGNIGLRVGDTVTYYDGVVAPELPVLEGVPYMAVVKRTTASGTTIHLLYSSIVAQEVTYDTHYSLVLAGVFGKYAQYDFENGTWVNVKPVTSTTLGSYSFLNHGVLWTNHNIKAYEDGVGSFVKHEKSDPIPVSGIVEYINGIPIYEKEDS